MREDNKGLIAKFYMFAENVSLSISKNKDSFLDSFAASVLCGFFVHFDMLANEYLNHDSIHYYSNNGDWALEQGKWFCTPINSITGPYVLRYFDGAIGLLVLALISGIICMMFKVPHGVLCWSIGCAIVSFPSVATMLAYQSLDYFAFAALFAVLAAFLLRFRKLFPCVFGVICLTLSIGAYQPFLGFTLSLLVLDCLIMLASNEKIIKVIKIAIQYLMYVFLALVMYYAVLKVCLFRSGLSLSPYKGINNMKYNLEPKVLVNSAINAYKDVGSFFIMDCFGLKENDFCWLYIAAVMLCIICYFYCGRFFGTLYKMKLYFGFIVGLLFFPLTINIVGVLSSNTSFYYISIYSFVIVFLCPVFFISSTYTHQKNNGYMQLKKKLLLPIFVILEMFLSCGKWSIQDNTAYRKLALCNKQISSELTVLSANIQNTEGFTQDMPVVFWGDVPIPFLKPSSVSLLFDELNTEDGMTIGNAQYEMNDRHQVQNYLMFELGMDYNFVDSSTVSAEYNVDNMSVYPDNGSIKIVDGMLFVKISDN